MTLYSTGVLDKKETKQKWGTLRHYLSASFKLLALLHLCFLAVLFVQGVPASIRREALQVY